MCYDFLHLNEHVTLHVLLECIHTTGTVKYTNCLSKECVGLSNRKRMVVGLSNRKFLWEVSVDCHSTKDVYYCGYILHIA